MVECVGLPEIALNHLASEVGTNLIFSEAIEAPFEIESIRKLSDSGLTVTTLWLPDGQTLAVTGAGYSPEGHVEADDDPAVRALLAASAD